MEDFGFFLLVGGVCIVVGGLTIGFAIEKFQKKQYIRFGIYLMITIPYVLGMVKLCLM